MSETDEKEETFMNVPRKDIDWYPRIRDTCDGCGDCLKFCPHDVLEEVTLPDGKTKVRVKNPTNCVVFCRACQKMCPLDVMGFPDKKATLDAIKKLQNGEV